jgi:hypothetical protein
VTVSAPDSVIGVFVTVKMSGIDNPTLVTDPVPALFKDQLVASQYKKPDPDGLNVVKVDVEAATKRSPILNVEIPVPPELTESGVARSREFAVIDDVTTILVNVWIFTSSNAAIPVALFEELMTYRRPEDSGDKLLFG